MVLMFDVSLLESIVSCASATRGSLRSLIAEM
jgi:hypothetical protein